MPDSEPGGATDALLANRYALGDVLGTGGMATVYRARDTVLGRSVAVKVLGGQSGDPDLLRRQQSEVALLASLSHHALVTLFDADVAPLGGEDRSYLVMELVDGPTLDTRILTGPIASADLERMAVDLAEALHVVHAAGIVHRDIKPANILLAPAAVPGREFSAKLADFGIASLVDSTRLTATGTVVGTAAYLSPEQALGAKVGPSADIYSLGLVLLEALTGRREFPGPMIESVAARLSRDPVVPGDVGYEWKSLLVAMTARDPEARPTAEEVLRRAGGLRSGGALAASDDTTAGMPTATRVLPAGAAAAAAGAAAAAPADATAATRVLPSERFAAAAAAPVDGRRRRSLPLVVVGIVLVLALLLVGALALARGFGGAPSAPTSPSPSPTTPSGTGSTTPTTPTSPRATSTSTVAPSDPATPDDVATTPAAPSAPVTPSSVPSAPTKATSIPVPQPTASTGNNGKGNKGKGNGNGK